MSPQQPQPVGELDDGVWTKTVWIPQIEGEADKQVERLRRDLDLEAVAAADGRQNLPARSDAALNATQLKICDQVFHEILMLNEFLAQEVGLALKRVRPMVPAKLDVRRARDQMNDAIESVFSDRRKELFNAKLKELEKLRDLRFFRFENSLKHSAEEKTSTVKVFALITVVFLFESIINGSLFSEVVSDGLMGGAILAGFISLVNISTGLLAGFYGWRYLGHRKTTCRYLIGLPIMLVCHGFAIFWNLLIAHFREVSEALAANASFNFDPAVLTRATMEHFAAHGLFGVTSVQSLGLLVLGLIIHFFSAKEGWDNLSDRYPDYSRIQLASVAAREAYEDALADARDQGREAIESIEARFNDTIGKTRRCCDGIAEMLELAAERRQEVRNSEDKCVAAGTQLLRTYREVNLKIRDEGTAPAYFDAYPAAADYRRRTFAGAPPSSDVAEAEKLTENAIAAMLEIRGQAKAALDEAEDGLAEVNRGVALALRALDQRIEAESKKIEVEAERKRRKDEEAPRMSAATAAEPVAVNDPA